MKVHYIYRETVQHMRGLAGNISKRIRYAKSLNERNEYIRLIFKISRHQYSSDVYNALEEIVYHNKYK
jgi:hypothetical protein